jgi:hypothetical protein
MNDNDLRGPILRRIYDARNGPEGWLRINDLREIVDEDPNQIARICHDLAQLGLIEWKDARGPAGSAAGLGKITAYGVNVIEGVVTSPIAITFQDYSVDHSVTVSGSSHNVQVGSGNTQIGNVNISVLTSAIDSANIPPAQKEEAKSMLQRLAENPVVWGIIGSFCSSGPTG